MRLILPRLLLAAAVLFAAALPSRAQFCWTDPNDTRCIAGTPVMYLNVSAQPIPVDATHGLPVNIVAGAVTANSSATATAAAPSYVEGTSDPLSQNLTGDLRTIAKQSGTWTVQPGNTANTTAWLTTDATIGANGAAAKTSTSLMGVSDGTNQQQLIAPISLADGVNGNNSIASGGYVWNGATWDRMRQIPLGITPTDKTVTSATGASQTLAAANASRHSLTVVNTGNANCGVNPTGGTAAIGGAGTLTLVPNGSYQPRIPTLSAVTAICTAGQPIYAEEN